MLTNKNICFYIIKTDGVYCAHWFGRTLFSKGTKSMYICVFSLKLYLKALRLFIKQNTRAYASSLVSGRRLAAIARKDMG
jgi:hypothetical protein